MSIEIKIPELGENIASGVVAKVLVSVGDTIEAEQPILELETDKAVLEVPSDAAGKVSEILVKEGEEVQVGQVVVRLDEGAASAEPAAPAVEKSPAPESKPAEAPKPEEPVAPAAEATPQEIIVKIPELGENITSGTVAKILVEVGQTVNDGDGLLELETDKAVLEVPAETEGKVAEVLVKEGDTVSIGQPIIKLIGQAARPAASPTPEPAAAQAPPAEPAAPAAEKSVTPESKPAEPAKPVEFKAPQFKKIAPAAPSVRRFAREIGIDIHEVPGTGPGGRISIDDVKRYAKTVNEQRKVSPAAAVGVATEPLPDFSKWGEVEVSPMSRVREKTATHLSYAWATIPHVTQFDKADITELEKSRKELAGQVEAAGGKLTMTAILAKVVAAALQKFPQFNASVDMKNRQIIYKKYVNIGIAVDTDRGLLVPVIKNADRKSLTELAVEIGALAKKARDKKLTLEEMEGGNFSISNLGGIGGTAFTPVVNSPEVAILGVSRSEIQPVYKDGEFVPRLMLPLSLSYDHRLIDGADGARFLRWIVQALENPIRIIL
ncbi:MAG: dihydrolipoyllysine-residue acetyltransferase [Calditrichia bacterium]